MTLGNGWIRWQGPISIRHPIRKYMQCVYVLSMQITQHFCGRESGLTSIFLQKNIQVYIFENKIHLRNVGLLVYWCLQETCSIMFGDDAGMTLDKWIRMLWRICLDSFAIAFLGLHVSSCCMQKYVYYLWAFGCSALVRQKYSSGNVGYSLLFGDTNKRLNGRVVNRTLANFVDVSCYW